MKKWKIYSIIFQKTQHFSSKISVWTRFNQVQQMQTLPEPRTGLKVRFGKNAKPWTELWSSSAKFRTKLWQPYHKHEPIDHREFPIPGNHDQRTQPGTSPHQSPPSPQPTTPESCRGLDFEHEPINISLGIVCLGQEHVYLIKFIRFLRNEQSTAADIGCRTYFWNGSILELIPGFPVQYDGTNTNTQHHGYTSTSRPGSIGPSEHSHVNDFILPNYATPQNNLTPLNDFILPNSGCAVAAAPQNNLTLLATNNSIPPNCAAPQNNLTLATNHLILPNSAVMDTMPTDRNDKSKKRKSYEEQNAHCILPEGSRRAHKGHRIEGAEDENAAGQTVKKQNAKEKGSRGKK